MSKKKIMLLCDDIRFHSGVAHMARECIKQTVAEFDWVNIGGAINHPETGKKLDLSQAIASETGVEDASVFIYPTNGYGTQEQIRELLKLEKPDALMLVTDPRYFTWLFLMEAEIRKTCPIVYLNIWDDYPAPMYNQAYYDSCDALLGISKQTVNINKLVLGELAKSKVIDYVPHGVDDKIFFPIEANNAELVAFKKQLFNGKQFDFVCLFNSRNIRRKQIPDLMFAWRQFLDGLTAAQREKVCLLLHTQPIDDNGTDLPIIQDYLFEDADNIIFHNQILTPQQMNLLYNSANCGALLSSNEGWGLMLTECLLTGTPFIANVTGGMQDQMGFLDDTGKWFTPSAEIPSNHTAHFKQHGEWCFPVYPSNRSIQGSVPTPYIFDDRCDISHVAAALKQAYDLGATELKRRGLSGSYWATTPEVGLTAYYMGQRLIKYLNQLFDAWTPRESFEFFNTNQYQKKKVPHNLYY